MTPSSHFDPNFNLAIAELLNSRSNQDLSKAFNTLSDSYRNKEAFRVHGNATQPLLLSYVAGRMPATFAVVKRILMEYIDLGGTYPHSIVDIGAGPATASFAAISVFGDVRVQLIEKETEFRNLAMQIAKASQTKPIIDGEWQIRNLAAKMDDISFKSDLAIASYSLGEMPLDLAKKIALNAFASASFGLIIIEPGTPDGFARIRSLRDALLIEGAFVAAPCPHQKICPMTGRDFCHFSERLNREGFHRRTKCASLPFEDEKFSYLILTKSPLMAYQGRLVKKPIKGSGHVTLDICSDGEIVRKISSRSTGESYKIARKLEWGDRC